MKARQHNWSKVEAGSYRLQGTDITVQQGAGWWWLGHADKDDPRMIDVGRENQPYETLTYALQAWAQAGLVAVGHPQAAQDCLDKMLAAGANLPQAIAIATDIQGLVQTGQAEDPTGKWDTPKEGTVTKTTPKTTLKGYKTHNTLAQADTAGKRLAQEQGRDIYVVARKRSGWGLCSTYYVLQYSAPKDGKWLSHWTPKDPDLETLADQYLPADDYVPCWAAPAKEEAIEKAARTYGGTSLLQDCALVHSATDLHGWGMYLAVKMEPRYVPLVQATIEADAERIVLKARDLGLTASWEVAS